MLAGAVKLVRQAHQGDEALLFIREPGFRFGEYALLTGEKTLVTVIAKTKTRLLILPKVEIDRIANEEPLYFRYFAMLAIGRISAYVKACRLRNKFCVDAATPPIARRKRSTRSQCSRRGSASFNRSRGDGPLWRLGTTGESKPARSQRVWCGSLRASPTVTVKNLARKCDATSTWLV